MEEWQHERHKAPTPIRQPRPLVLACPHFRSNVNLSRIVRVAGCCGVRRIIACGNPKIDRKIARDGFDQIALEVRRSLPPALKKLQREGFSLVGLEQTSKSRNLHQFRFPRRSVLVLGHERLGIEPGVLALLDHVVEIPVYGLPYSFNVATATAMALYEYCRQYPEG